MMKENRYFQFLAGERQGEVVLFDRVEEEDGVVFVCFKDGSRCNEEFILPLDDRKWSSQLMAEVEDHKNVWRFKEEWVGREEERWETNAEGEKVCVQPFVEGRKKVTPIPPKKSKSKFGNVESSSVTQVNEPTQENKKTVKMDDPVWVMMDRARKFDTEVPMSLTISLPTKALYDVAKESFEDGGNKVVEYIISNLDDSKLKESLRYALMDAYEDTTVVQEPIIKDRKPAMDIEKPSPNLYEPEVVEEPVIGAPKAEGDLKTLPTENDENADG